MVLVVGASGHARVCLEALTDDDEVRIVGCVSRDGSAVPGLKADLLGTDHDLADVARRAGATHVFVAIGDNVGRADCIVRCRDAGLSLINAISRFAMVSRDAHLGEGVAVLAGAVVNSAALLGDGVIVNTKASVDHDCRVGDAVHIGPGATLAGGVVVGQAALLGAGATILPNVSIGSGVVVGAGSVVVADVADGETVAGVPARPL